MYAVVRYTWGINYVINYVMSYRDVLLSWMGNIDQCESENALVNLEQIGGWIIPFVSMRVVDQSQCKTPDTNSMRKQDALRPHIQGFVVVFDVSPSRQHDQRSSPCEGDSISSPVIEVTWGQAMAGLTLQYGCYLYYLDILLECRRFQMNILSMFQSWVTN
jgi:hypothetical protein